MNLWHPPKKEATKKARFQGVIMIFPARWETTPWQWSKCDSVCQDRQHAQKGEWELWVWQPKTTVVSLSQPVCCSIHVDFYYFSGILALYCSTPILFLGWPVMSKEWSAYTVWCFSMAGHLDAVAVRAHQKNSDRQEASLLVKFPCKPLSGYCS